MPGGEDPNLNYEHLTDAHRVTVETWDGFVRAALLEPWLQVCRAATPWRAGVMEIAQGA